jgi:hypothetical protein
MTTHNTRFTANTGIAFRDFGAGHWQHIDTSDDRDAQVGPIYKTRAELLADHEAYLRRAGWIKEAPPESVTETLIAALKAARKKVRHDSMCALETEFNKPCDCVISTIEAALAKAGA